MLILFVISSKKLSVKSRLDNFMYKQEYYNLLEKILVLI